MVLVRLPNEQQSDSMKNYTLKAAPAALAKELKNKKAPKAKRMAVGIDT
jgi:hypothetical protein